MTLTDLAKSYVRTVVPVVVGAVIAFALRHGVDLHGYVVQVTAVVTVGYYALARLAEQYVSPKFGWLLGYATPPDYSMGKVRTLKARPSGGESHHTIVLHADTSQFIADLKAVQAEAKRTAAAVAKAKRG